MPYASEEYSGWYSIRAPDPVENAMIPVSADQSIRRMKKEA